MTRDGDVSTTCISLARTVQALPTFLNIKILKIIFLLFSQHCFALCLVFQILWQSLLRFLKVPNHASLVLTARSSCWHCAQASPP